MQLETYDAAGGTNRPGVPPDVFRMPDGMRMRYDIPSPALARAVTAYAIYISDDRAPMTNWYLPGPAMISILLDAGRVDVSIRNWTHRDVPRISLYGPTSVAPRTLTHGGIMVGIGLTAAGWARLTSKSAHKHLNQIMPLSTIVGAPATERLYDALARLTDDALIAPTLDEHLPKILGEPHSLEPALSSLTVLGLTDGVISIDEVASALGMEVHTLRRISNVYFGLAPKALLSRARFIRSLSKWLLNGEPMSYEGMDSSYFDVSHFLRDAGAYLGTTPRRFARSETHYLKASLRARQAVLGAPAHALHA